MLTLTYVYIEYEISFSSLHIWNDILTKMIVLEFISAPYTITFTEHIWN